VLWLVLVLKSRGSHSVKLGYGLYHFPALQHHGHHLAESENTGSVASRHPKPLSGNPLAVEDAAPSPSASTAASLLASSAAAAVAQVAAVEQLSGLLPFQQNHIK
jgi:hypothetical protein